MNWTRAAAITVGILAWGQCLLGEGVTGHSLANGADLRVADTRAAAATNQAIERFVAQHAPHYVGHTEGRIMPGNQRTLGDVNVFVPLWQGHNEMLYADVRGQMDDGSNYEGNWGFGYRALLDSDMVVGGYAYYDSRWTEHGNHFNQMTLGIEAMTVGWDFRMNGYLPDTNVKTIDGMGGGAPSVQLVGNQLFIVTPGEMSEVAYYGGDFEIGRLLRAWGPNNQIELRGFAGAYHFDSDEAVDNITGPRARLELRAFDLKRLGHGSRLTLGADYQWDQVRNDQYFGSATVRIPFGPGSRQLNPLERRMVDRVVRDVDIVSNTQTEAGEQEAALYADNNLAVKGVHVINPTDDAADIAHDAPKESLLVVNGTNTSTSVIYTNEGQRVVGGGTQVALKGATSGTLINYQTPGTAGMLSAELRAADRVMIDNITLDHAQLSIVGSEQVTVRNTTVDGGRFYVYNSSALIEDSNATNNDFALVADRSQLTVRDSNLTTTNHEAAVSLYAGGSATTMNALIENSTLTTAGSMAVFASNNWNGTTNLTLRHNDISATDNMIRALRYPGDVFNLSMTGNTPLSGNGIELDASSNSISVEQADAATLSSLNGGAVIDPIGTILYNQPAPALPTWP